MKNIPLRCMLGIVFLGLVVGCQERSDDTPSTVKAPAQPPLKTADVIRNAPAMPRDDDSKTPMRPIWAKRATTLRDGVGSKEILSPDRRVAIRVDFQPGGDLDRNLLLRIKSPDGNDSVVLDEGASELLWADDSKAFLVNGGDSAYADFFVAVYSIQEGHVRHIDVTASAQRDMVAMFPPCKAAHRDVAFCKQVEKNPQYNMSGLDLVDGSARIIVFAEVIPSSGYGGIMGQVLGYELEVPSGRILMRMTAKETKERWQSQAAWNIHIPDPPVYLK